MFNQPINRNVFIISLIMLLLMIPTISDAAQQRPPSSPMGPKPGWSFPLQGAFTHQFETDIDNNGGSFSVDRAFLQGGITYTTKKRQSFSLSLTYGFDGYDFEGNRGFAGLRPWKDINTYQLSTPVLWGWDDKWTLFAMPSVRFSGESGVNLGDGTQGALFAGASYRFSDRLTIGPGIGIVTQIEDNATIFPVLIINWKITDTLSLGTGSGAGATLGPGVFLNWKAARQWRFSVGGRFEKLRFRLNDNGIAPKGVGEDRSFPLLAGMTYYFTPLMHASLMVGVDLGGKLELADENGNQIVREDYDTAGFAGIMLRFRF
ncbi:hypothetical protein ACFL4N_08450 [Thermodesulfobacteriota bacterium]